MAAQGPVSRSPRLFLALTCLSLPTLHSATGTFYCRSSTSSQIRGQREQRLMAFQWGRAEEAASLSEGLLLLHSRSAPREHLPSRKGADGGGAWRMMARFHGSATPVSTRRAHSGLTSRSIVRRIPTTVGAAVLRSLNGVNLLRTSAVDDERHGMRAGHYCGEPWWGVWDAGAVPGPMALTCRKPGRK